MMIPKRSLGRWALFFLLAVSATVRGQSLGSTSPGSAPSSPNLIRDNSLGFTVAVPSGWVIKNYPHGHYPMACGPATDGITPNLDLETERFSGSLNDYVAANLTSFQQNLTAFKILKQEDFVSATGVKAVKVTTQNIQFHTNLLQLFYFFQGPDQNFILLSGTASAKSAPQFSVDFDASAKSLNFAAPVPISPAVPVR
jgi:hypothetical protein